MLLSDVSAGHYEALIPFNNTIQSRHSEKDQWVCQCGIMCQSPWTFGLCLIVETMLLWIDGTASIAGKTRCIVYRDGRAYSKNEKLFICLPVIMITCL